MTILVVMNAPEEHVGIRIAGERSRQESSSRNGAVSVSEAALERIASEAVPSSQQGDDGLVARSEISTLHAPTGARSTSALARRS